MGNLLHMAISSLLSDYQDLMQNMRYHKRLVITNGDDPCTIPRKSGKIYIMWTCTLNNLSSLFIAAMMPLSLNFWNAWKCQIK